MSDAVNLEEPTFHHSRPFRVENEQGVVRHGEAEAKFQDAWHAMSEMLLDHEEQDWPTAGYLRCYSMVAGEKLVAWTLVFGA